MQRFLRRWLGQLSSRQRFWIFIATAAVLLVLLLRWALAEDRQRGSLSVSDSNPVVVDNIAEHPTSSTLLPTPRYPWKTFFIAINLYNNMEVLPHLERSLIRFLNQELSPYFDISARVVLSIFSNGSEDDTSRYIDDTLIPHLKEQTKLRRIVSRSKGTCCNGLHRRPKEMDRIEWMACVRNGAMQPLYHHGMRLFDAPLSQSSFPASSDDKNTNTNSEIEGATVEVVVDSFDEIARLHLPEVTRSTPNATKSAYLQAEVSTEAGRKHVPIVVEDRDTAVLFFNDVHFRPEDVTVLLESGYERAETKRKELGEDGDGQPQPAAYQRSNSEGFDMACGMDFYFSFYDVWVTRGADGRPFSGYPPYAQDAASQAILRPAAPLAFPEGATTRPSHASASVRCCWNGLAIIRASMFLSHGVRFRKPETSQFNMSRQDTHCYSSECLLICQDILAVRLREQQQQEESRQQKQQRPSVETGSADWPSNSILLNPYVRVAYEEDSFQLHQQHWLMSSTWYFPLAHFLQFWLWMVPESPFTAPPPTPVIGFHGADEQQELVSPWVACLLPVDTFTGSRYVWHVVSSRSVTFWIFVCMGVIVAVAASRRRSTSRWEWARGVTRSRVCTSLGAPRWCDAMSFLYWRVRNRWGSASGGGKQRDDDDSGVSRAGSTPSRSSGAPVSFAYDGSAEITVSYGHLQATVGDLLKNGGETAAAASSYGQSSGAVGNPHNSNNNSPTLATGAGAGASGGGMSSSHGAGIWHQNPPPQLAASLRARGGSNTANNNNVSSSTGVGTPTSSGAPRSLSALDAFGGFGRSQ